jgi:hypothetical protein
MAEAEEAEPRTCGRVERPSPIASSSPEGAVEEEARKEAAEARQEAPGESEERRREGLEVRAPAARRAEEVAL